MYRTGILLITIASDRYTKLVREADLHYSWQKLEGVSLL